MKLKQRFSMLKGTFLIYLLFLIFFFTALPFFSMLLYWESDFSQSILPVLIGFCLNGMFLLLVFAVFEDNALMKSRQQNKLFLRTLLTPFIACGLKEGTQMQRMQILPNPGAVRRIIEQLTDLDAEAKIWQDMQRLANSEERALQSVTALTVQIGNDHLGAWLTLLDAIKGLSNHNDPATLRTMALRTLEAIEEFDELEL